MRLASFVGCYDHSASTDSTGSGSLARSGVAAGVRLNRGAGAAWAMPSRSTIVLRAAMCGCAATSPNASTGVTQASVPSNAAAHSSRVRVANTAANRSFSCGQCSRSCWPARSASARPSPASSAA